MSPEDAARYSEHWKELGIGSDKTWNEFIKNYPGASVDDYFTLIKDQSPWPINYNPENIQMSSGYQFEIALANGQPAQSPGRFATTPNTIKDVDYVRTELAVKPEWKPSIDRVAVYEVKDGVNIQGLKGPVGPQIVLQNDLYLPGGADQVQILLDRNINMMDYLTIKDVRAID